MGDEASLELKDLFQILRKRFKIIVAVTLLATIAAGVISFFLVSPTYEASTSIIIGKTGDEKKDVQYNDVLMYQNLVKTYSEIAKSKVVAQKTLDKLDSSMTVDQLQKIMTITPLNNTQIINISIKGKNAKECADTVNALADSFISEATRLYPSGNVQVIDKAEIPKKPVKPNKKLNVAIAFLLGLMVSTGIVFIIDYMDNTIKSEEDVEKYLELPVLGVIPKYSQD